MNHNSNAQIQATATADQTIDQKNAIIADSIAQELLETNPVAEMSILRMLFHIFKNGMIGSITLILCFALIAVELILMGHVDKSYIFISAKGNAIVLADILQIPV